MDDSPLTPVTGVEITGLLRAWSAGDSAVLEVLTPVVYAELHRQARLLMAREPAGHLLQPSALVNEAFLRLASDVPPDWESRRQFFAVAAGVMRRVLVDFARTHGAAKRGAGMKPVDIDSAMKLAAPNPGLGLAELVDIDEALTRLAALDERQSRVVELRFFGGLEVPEVAAILNVSEPTVVRDWRMARAWLYSALSPARNEP